MLNLNRPGDGPEGEGGWSSDWKILVYDAFCRDVISPLFSAGELRRQGVTLYLLLDSEREAIPDVPAVYFVQPTEANVRRIVSDCGEALYNKVYINFCAPLPRPLLEGLARGALQNNGVSNIAKLYDQFLSFLCLEPSLFSLNLHRSFTAYNDPRLAEAQVCQPRAPFCCVCVSLCLCFMLPVSLPTMPQIEATMRAIATGLFAVFAVLGVPPIIKCASRLSSSRLSMRMVYVCMCCMCVQMPGGWPWTHDCLDAGQHDSGPPHVLLLLPVPHRLLRCAAPCVHPCGQVTGCYHSPAPLIHVPGDTHPSLCALPSPALTSSHSPSRSPLWMTCWAVTPAR